jgi:hypothetical protein
MVTMTTRLWMILVLLIVVLRNTVPAEGLRSQRDASGVIAVRDGPGSTVTSLRRLKEQLNIGDNPNEDIRTNRLLNMEGI